jgi:hypothetical protein
MTRYESFEKTYLSTDEKKKHLSGANSEALGLRVLTKRKCFSRLPGASTPLSWHRQKKVHVAALEGIHSEYSRGVSTPQGEA